MHVQWKLTVELMMWFINVTLQGHCRKICILDLYRENGKWKTRFVFITTSYDLQTRDISVRQHFQVICCTWKVFQVKHLTWSGQFWDAQISQRNASGPYMKNSKQLLIKTRRNSWTRVLNSYVNISMPTSSF